MAELLLTVEQAATRLQMHPVTIRRQIKTGVLKAVKAGRQFRIPESELTPTFHADTPQTRAAQILAGLDSDDAQTRNAAIVSLSRADEKTSAIVEEAAARAVEEWDGDDDDFSDWRALDSEPFHFPEEAPDYLEGLYRADATAQANKTPRNQKEDTL